MSNSNKLSENGQLSTDTAEDWTLPVMDSSLPQEQGAEHGFDPAHSGAWTSFAIGAVTKSVERERHQQHSAAKTSKS